MESLQILYIVLAAVGMLFLMISIFTGGEADLDLNVGDADFDVSDAESGSDSVAIFSIRTLSTFLLGFGIAGWTVMRGDGGVFAQLLAGFGAGLAISFLYFLVMKGMYAMQGSSMATTKDLIGKQGTITIPTTKTGIAQVRLATVSGNSEYTCKEVKGRKLKQNDTVTVITADMGIGTLVVEKV